MSALTTVRNFSINGSFELKTVHKGYSVKASDLVELLTSSKQDSLDFKLNFFRE